MYNIKYILYWHHPLQIQLPSHISATIQQILTKLGSKHYLYILMLQFENETNRIAKTPTSKIFNNINTSIYISLTSIRSFEFKINKSRTNEDIGTILAKKRKSCTFHLSLAEIVLYHFLKKFNGRISMIIMWRGTNNG